jgi:selenocysteine-specific elongation factor
LEWSGLSPQKLQAAVQRSVEDKEAFLLGGENGLFQNAYLVSPTGLERIFDQIRNLLNDYHLQYPLRPSMPKEELRSRLDISDDLFRLIMPRALEAKLVNDNGAGVSLAEFHVMFTPQQQKQVDNLLNAHRAAMYTPPTRSDALKVHGLDSELFQALVTHGDLVGVGDDIYFLASVYHEMVSRLVAYLREHEKITVAETRDLFGASRRYTLAFLTHLDQKVTRRIGDERYLK